LFLFQKIYILHTLFHFAKTLLKREFYCYLPTKIIVSNFFHLQLQILLSSQPVSLKFKKVLPIVCFGFAFSSTMFNLKCLRLQCLTFWSKKAKKVKFWTTLLKRVSHVNWIAWSKLKKCKNVKILEKVFHQTKLWSILLHLIMKLNKLQS
jgi:hypothetical protein